MGNSVLYRLGLLWLAIVSFSFLCLSPSPFFVMADRLRVLRASGRKRRPIIVKNYLPFDSTDGKPIKLTKTKAPPPQPQTRRDGAPSVPQRLVQPFAAALLPNNKSNNNHEQPHLEIKTEKLLDACRTLEDSMVALGQDRNAAEIARNIRKVEALHQMAPPGRRETLRSLLEYEKELGVHGPNGKLKDASGAMGLLWIRRSLAFQERMYSQLLENPVRPPHEVALEAYRDTLEPYHGWALQQLYSVALKKTTPPRHDFFQKLCAVPEDKFGLAEERETAQDLQRLCDTWKPVSIAPNDVDRPTVVSLTHPRTRLCAWQLLNTWEEIYVNLGLEDPRKV